MQGPLANPNRRKKAPNEEEEDGFWNK